MRLMMRLSENAISRARVDLCKLILETPIEQISRCGNPKILAALTTDMDIMSAGYRALINALLNTVVVLSSIAYLFAIYVPFGVMLLSFLLVGVVIQNRATRWPIARAAQARRTLDSLHESLSRLVRGARELQLNRQRATFYLETAVSRYAGKTAQLVAECMGQFALVTSLGELMFFSALLLLLLPVFSPHATATVTASAIIVMLFVSSSIGELLHLLPDMGRATASLSHVLAMFDIMQQAPRVTQQKPSPKPHFESIELRELIHEYTTNGTHAFKVGPVNFTLQPSEIVFIVGGNGSGKTTLMMLLLGLYEPKDGCILLNRKNIEAHELDRYRSYFSAVFSDYELFDTIFDCSLETAARATVLLEKLRLGDKTSITEGRFSSMALSSGQRKRLALVSAYLEDRPVYVFDEWAADQDPQFRHMFYSELLPELRRAGKAVVAITHDSQYFHYADRVLQMCNGRLSAWSPTSTMF
ncbi:ABC-type siderophore export system [Acidisarcina polymorpha]|uniref:ABC-type siderophore export system n=1 Tax=Acidisarcina polymorpha TaxID=2211140 RepID=A0A2Z5FVG4_9BACT|nr:ABC-type siderophore export system [Acidisarcina polymorpha]